ncbi:hypothetical protein JTB14_008660 [Gonioctena quinquepunctata]|nr:hypothetical protein JTB14_008660 [Gonioctena quinquepunctata]
MGFRWLEDNHVEKPIILFLDGHRSHMTQTLSEFCQNNGIVLYALPPNTTHILQPADNILEQQNELNVETNDPLTSEEIRAAEKVILRLRNKPIPKGVNGDLIFDEIKILENEASRQIVIEVGDMIPLDDVTIIPFDNIYVQNNNINLSEPIAKVSYEQSTESTLLNSEIPSCDDTVLPIGYHTNNDDYDTVENFVIKSPISSAVNEQIEDHSVNNNPLLNECSKTSSDKATDQEVNSLIE